MVKFLGLKKRRFASRALGAPADQAEPALN
jgi:hypothetical protein